MGVPGNDQKVLIVDDNRLSAHLLAATATREGFATTIAYDGKEALQILAREEVHILITDWEMPRISGLELVQQLRADQGAPYRYIIMVTCYGDLTHRTMGLKAGADDFLGKPVDDAEVTARLRVARRIISMSRDLQLQRDELAANQLRLESELEQAAKVQRSLLPALPPTEPGWDLAWRVRPCDQLGGDSLGLIRFEDGTLGAYVFDVTGHGVTAALLATQVSRALDPDPRAGSPLYQRGEDGAPALPASPGHVLSELNRRFQMDVDVPQLVAMCYALIDRGTGRVSWSCAAIPAPYLIAGRGSWTREQQVGPFLGMIPTASYTDRVAFLAPGDRFVLTSDGIHEAMDPARQQFGEGRVAAYLDKAMAASADALADGLLAEVAGWQGTAERGDDQAVLVIGRER